MKKIFTFLFCTAIISSAFSQTAYRQAKYRSAVTSYRINAVNSPYELINQRNREIDEINEQNNYDVQIILSKTNLNIWDKRDILNDLEVQRIAKLNNVYSRFNSQVAWYKNIERKNSYDKKPQRD